MEKKDVIQRLREDIQCIERGVVSGSPRVSAEASSCSEVSSKVADSLELCVRDASEAEDAKTVDDAFRRILRLASVRERCCSELRDRLGREEYPEAVIDAALDKAVCLGVVSDERYAEQYLRAKLASGKGMRGIAAELSKKGIVLASSEECIECLDDEIEIERALRILELHPPRSKNKREGAYRKLIQKGYSSSVASSASRIWFESGQN